ncbi:tetratricopeptide repeat protein [Alkalihalobacillus pseudalcaliphilus]|uniref:tetratricopeptide repeat protein n=1 Tax=Alkalihalobacillus pseudalcaliphilus TaxID=79884 RepID=UPI00064E0011|nr:hypothetical protein [Alkalihalobacillus pseudalcaliphilus]KMK76243.1 hypothetical protein AB990_13615 [Alkalihalobacillus pseudalcaliphilus]
MNTNQKAIQALENNDYNQAMGLFTLALKESRDVQSLTNLAWLYYYDDTDSQSAIQLLVEAIQLKPTSHFPYSLLGEIYVTSKRWKQAKEVLQCSIQITESEVSLHNLAAASYHLQEVEEASRLFQKSAIKGSNVSLYAYTKCLIDLGRDKEAKEQVKIISLNEDDFVGELEVADLYYELCSYDLANQWYQQSWDDYYKEPDWIQRYAYSLLQSGDNKKATDIVNQAMSEKEDEIEDAFNEECDEDWSVLEKDEFIQTLDEQRQEYKQMMEKLMTGYRPCVKFEAAALTACYLFGCQRHHHREYSFESK